MSGGGPTPPGGHDGLPPRLGPDGQPLPPIKKREKRHAHEKKLDVSINSLLDVLSVILVFLMKSYSTSTVQVKPSPDLQVPFSHSTQAVEESTSITMTLKNIMVDDVPVMTLEKGVVQEQDLSSGGMLIEPLFQKLVDEVAHQKKIATHNESAKFKGICTVIGDRYVPNKLLTQIMYTAGQAEFGTFKFAAIKSER